MEQAKVTTVGTVYFRCVQKMISPFQIHLSLAKCKKTTWMHSHSQHWYLISCVIVRKRDMPEVYVTKIMSGAKSWTDYILIISKMKIVNPPGLS